MLYNTVLVLHCIVRIALHERSLRSAKQRKKKNAWKTLIAAINSFRAKLDHAVKLRSNEWSFCNRAGIVQKFCGICQHGKINHGHKVNSIGYSIKTLNICALTKSKRQQNTIIILRIDYSLRHIFPCFYHTTNPS